MFGLVVLLVSIAYVAVMICAVVYAWRAGRRNGGSKRKALAYAGLGFLVVYLPVFWNHIPVLIAHRSMCAKDAGFSEFLTPELWAAQNNAAITQLTKETIERQKPTSQSVQTSEGYRRELSLGGLLAVDWRGTDHIVLNVAIHKEERRVVDVGSGRTLATYVSYSASGNPDDIRGWVFPSKCLHNDSLDPRARYLRYLDTIHLLVRTK